MPADDQVTSLSAIGGNANHGPPAFTTTHYTDSNAHSNTYSNGNGDAYTYSYTKAFANAAAFRHTESPSDAGASPIAEK